MRANLLDLRGMIEREVDRRLYDFLSERDCEGGEGKKSELSLSNTSLLMEIMCVYICVLRL